ncbi:MAG: multidrug effflux MFS transporter [Gammaproteobacteria bacterium]|nr:multidrug effflux MFS transporter [Gammaproteobacteria bacterium]MCH9762773.1 multidrug effflux MFS transporter [Gammaproteobacteria bacterium]
MNAIQWSSKQCLLKLFPLIITISFAMDVFVPAIPNMTTYFQTTPRHMQSSLYLFMLTVAIGQLFIGPLADHFGRRCLAQYTAAFFLFGSLLSSLACTIPVLLIARIIQATGACGTYLLCFIIIRDNFSTQDCGRLFSLLTGVNAIAASTAPIIGGILLDVTDNWRSGFYFLTLLGLLINFTVYKNISVYHYIKPHASERLWSQWKKVLRNTHFKKYALVSANGMLGLYLFCALSPEVLITQLNLSGTAYGLWFGLNAFTAFVANFIAARLTTHTKLEYIIRWGLLMMLMATFAMIGFNFFSTSILSFMIPMLCLTIGIGMSMGCATALALKDFESIAGTATSLITACQFSVAGIIGALITYWSLGPMSLAIPMLILLIINNKAIRLHLP